MFKNIKIEVNAEQTLDEIVLSLKKLGYQCRIMTAFNPKTVCAYFDGTMYSYASEHLDLKGELTTLAELKEM